MNISQFSNEEHSHVGDAYRALFELIQSFPDPLRNTWWSGAYRTLDHFTANDQLAAIKVYAENAQKAHERYVERMKQS